MITPTTKRGLSEVLGAILMFALVFSLLVIVQVWAVPTANAQVELQHSEGVGTELGEFGETLERVAATGGSESASIQAGLRYPSRIFLLNPPPASYTFASSAVSDDGISVTGLRAIDSEAGDYVDRGINLSTQWYSLRTDYAEYENAPVYHIEGSVIYKQFDFDNEEPAVSFIDRGAVVSGRTINLVALQGDIAVGGADSLAVPVRSVGGTTRSLSVTDDGTPITIALRTQLSTAEWKKLLAEEAYVQYDTISVADGLLTFKLVQGETYDLRISALRIGSSEPATAPAAYVTAVSGTDASLLGGRTSLTVEVRDRYNNPVSGENVRFTRGSFDENVTTDQTGQAVVNYDGPVGAVEAQLNDHAGNCAGAAECVVFDVVDGNPITNTGTASAGQGGLSKWDATNNSEEFSVPNGLWTDISTIETITLSDGQPITDIRCGYSGIPAGTLFSANCADVDTLQLSFTLVGDDASDARKGYYVNLLLEDANRDGDFDATPAPEKENDPDPESMDEFTLGSGSNEVTYNDIRRVQIVDESGVTLVDANLTKAAAMTVLSGTGIDLLDASNYEDVSVSQDDLNALKLNDAVWFTTTMEGRITVTIEG